MQNLVRSKTLGVTGYGGRGTAGAGPGRDLLYRVQQNTKGQNFCLNVTCGLNCLNSHFLCCRVSSTTVSQRKMFHRSGWHERSCIIDATNSSKLCFSMVRVLGFADVI